MFVNGTLNAQKYRQDNSDTFQQDKARPHVARDNMDYLRRYNIDVLPRPGRLNCQICQQYNTYGISWVEWFVNVNSSPDVGSVLCCLCGRVTAYSTSVIQHSYSLYATSMCVGDQ